MLAHLSKDQRLIQVTTTTCASMQQNVEEQGKQKTKTLCPQQVLNGGADVFRCIAAEWKSVDPESVKDDLRQQAKQVPARNDRKTWTCMHSH